jgi:hypothetical protein
MKRFKFILLTVFFILNLEVFSQKEPIKFGKPELSDLEMTVYPPDSSASAVILCNYGYFDGDDYMFTRVIRIKILKPEGLIWADHTFPTSERSMITGYTYNLDENGGIVKDKLKNESIYRNKITYGFSNIRVAMPNVKVGSVFDIEFSHYGLPYEWRFQEIIPVKHSELIIDPNKYIDFKKHFVGYLSLSVSTDNRWVAENMPAFKEEPYMNCIENYITKFDIELKDLFFWGHYYPVSDSWNSIGDLLIENEYFGKLSEGIFLKEIAENIKKSCTNNEQMLIAACDSIKKVKWNDESRLFTESNFLKHIYTEKIGNSSEINFLLYELLKQMDFQVSPVVLSTRDNGYIAPWNPSINKLNYMIVKAVIDDQEYFIDATEKYLPYYLLPKRCLNNVAVIIEKGKCKPIDIGTKKKDRMITTYDLNLSEDLSLKGKMSNIRYDYAAYDFRKLFSEFNSEESFLEDITNKKFGLSIDSFDIVNKDNLLKPITDTYYMNINHVINDNGTELLFNPFLFEQIKDNPFKSEKREYPIDFGYMTERVVTINIKYPESFIISQLPATLNLKISDNSAKFSFMINNVDHTLQLTYKLNLDKGVYLPEIYPELREFYNQIINKSSEYIIIKKS